MLDEFWPHLPTSINFCYCCAPKLNYTYCTFSLTVTGQKEPTTFKLGMFKLAHMSALVNWRKKALKIKWCSLIVKEPNGVCLLWMNLLVRQGYIDLHPIRFEWNPTLKTLKRNIVPMGQTQIKIPQLKPELQVSYFKKAWTTK